MKEYGLTDEELKALGEEPIANGQNILTRGTGIKTKQEPQEQIWDGDLDWLLACWF